MTERKYDRLKMPRHNVPSGLPANDGKDLMSWEEGIVCRASTVPGYALDNHDGTLHCNRCGWVTPEPVITSYSPDTGHTYLTFDELISAEASGWVVVGTSTRPGTAPILVGPYDTQADARKARSRLRPKWARQEARDHGDGHTISTMVRVLWKENGS